MSDGTYCVIRDLGLVKGGKGMRHHEVLMTVSLKALLKGVRARCQSLVRSVTQRSGPSNSGQTAASGTRNELPATKS